MNPIKKNLRVFGYELPFDKDGNVNPVFVQKLEKVLLGEEGMALSCSDKKNIEAFINYADKQEDTRGASKVDKELGWDL